MNKLWLKIIGLINVVLILIIVINIVNFGFKQFSDKDYMKFLGYIFFKVDEGDKFLEFNKGDLLIIDVNKSPNVNNVVFYSQQEDIKFGKVLKVLEKKYEVGINNEANEILEEQVLGVAIKNVPKIGDLLRLILTLKVFLISFFALIITSFLQIILNNNKKDKKKIEFNKYKNNMS